MLRFKHKAKEVFSSPAGYPAGLTNARNILEFHTFDLLIVFD
jgi:hypothetical protein